MTIRTISNAGGDWMTATTWVEGIVPTNADDVVATATSGALQTGVAGAVCRSLDLTNMTGAVTGSSALTVGSSTAGPSNILVKIPASGFTYSRTSSLILTTSAPSPQTVSVLRTIGHLVSCNGLGTVLLVSSLNLGSNVISHTNGTLDLNGQTITAQTLQTSGSNTRTLIFGAANATLSNTGGSGFDAQGTNYTISADLSTISLGGSSGFSGGGATYGTVRWLTVTGNSPGISGNNTFTNLSFAATINAEIHFLSGTTQSVTGQFSMTNTNGKFIVGTGSTNFINTFNAGAPATIALGTTGTAVLSNVNFMDMIFTGTNTPVSGTRLGDGQGNSGIGFDARRTLYWVGNGGNWSDSGRIHWALASGGTPGAGVLHPLPQDDVIIDNNSFSAAGQTIVCDQLWLCRNLTANVSQTGCQMTVASQGSVFGNIVSGGTGGFLHPGTLILRSRGASIYDALGPSNGVISIQAPNGTVSFVRSMQVNVLNLYAGTLDAAGYDVTLRSFTAFTLTGTTFYARELKMGGGQWTCLNGSSTGWQTQSVANLFTLTRGTSTLRFTGTPVAANTTIQTSGQLMPPLSVELASRELALNDAGPFSSIDLVSGGLNAPVSVTISSLTSTGSLPRTLTLSASVTNFNVQSLLKIAGTNFTLNVGSGQVNLAASVSEMIAYTNGITFGVLRCNPLVGGVVAIYDQINAAQFSISGPSGGVGTVIVNDSANLTTSFSAVGNSVTNRVRVYGPSWGGRSTITAPATAPLTNVDLINIDQAGSGAWTGTSKTNSFTGYTNQAVLS